MVAGDAPQQRMLRLASRASKASAYFNLKASRVKDSTYTVTITSSSLQKQVGSQVSCHFPFCHCMSTSRRQHGSSARQSNPN